MRALVAALFFLALHSLAWTEELPVDTNIAVSAAVVGTVAENSFDRSLSNGSGVVFLSNYWGANAVKYLRADDSAQFIFSTKAATRDISVTTWGEDCVVFLRSSGGKAWYFRYNYNTGAPNGRGILAIGIVTGLTAGPIDRNGKFYGLYSNNDLQSTVDGYNPAETAGASFIFSVQGFRICAGYNGVQITCFTDYRRMSPGIVQVQCNAGGGIRDTRIQSLIGPAMYSDPSNNILDMRDFGAKPLATTGAISEGSPDLKVASSEGFAVGDEIIVATGGEAATGPGTIGVGGALPKRTYANLTVANADLPNQADGAWMRTLDTELVYRKYKTWISYSGQLWYQTSANPIALVAHITAISGNVLTLDQSAVTTTTNASVYFDNGAAFSSVLAAAAAGVAPLTPTNLTVNIPTGTLGFYSGPGSTTLSVGSDKVNWVITGQGAANTKLLTPTGVRSFTSVLAPNGMTLQYLTIQGNAQNVGYTVDFVDAQVSGGGTFLPATIFSGSNDVMRDVTCINVFADCFGSNYATNPLGYNVSAILTDGLQSYTQWQFQIANTSGGGCFGCSLQSPYLVPGFESFSSSNVIYSKTTSLNGAFACNSCTNVLFDSPVVRITPMSQLSEMSFSENNPVFNMNTNIASQMLQGSTIRNPTVVQEGYINSSNDSLIFVSINNQNAGVAVSGTYPDASDPKGCFSMPDFAGTNGFRGIGVRNDGNGTTISGMRFIGHTDYRNRKGNIQSEVGSLAARNNVMDKPVQGGAAYVEAGTQSNATWNAAHSGRPGC